MAVKSKVVLEPGDYKRDEFHHPVAPMQWASYRVVQAVNTLSPVLFSELTPDQVQRLIDSGVEVVINPRKK